MRRMGVSGLAVSMVVVVGVAAVAARTGSPSLGAGAEPAASTAPTAGSSTTTVPASSDPPIASTTSTPPAADPPRPPPPPADPFEPARIAALVEALAPYPGTLAPRDPPPITGDVAADARIRAMAEARGYRVRPVAQVQTVVVDGVAVHPDAAADLTDLLGEMRALGMTVAVRSAFRSVDVQRDIFLREFGEEGGARIGRPYETAEVVSGAADEALAAVLRYHSIPGYSRHHTGLAVDFEASDGPLSRFEGTPPEEWLRADAFANARRHGFLPSYPRGADPQGPNPEPWEYIYVGRGAIGCAADPDLAVSDLAVCATSR